MDERICHSSVGFQLCLWERKTGKQRTDFQTNSEVNGNLHIAKSLIIFTFKKHGVCQGQLTFRAIRIQWSGSLLSNQQSCQSYSGYFQEPHWRSMGLPEISCLTWQLWKWFLKVLYQPEYLHIDGLVQERCNSIANALELHLSCTNPWIYLHSSMNQLVPTSLSGGVPCGVLSLLSPWTPQAYQYHMGLCQVHMGDCTLSTTMNSYLLLGPNWRID